MAAPDLEVIKDIPGYKVILKAIIKAQIQQLVEQLAVHTDEESVILTASVADGTLSHLGSDSGKGFLAEQEDVKTQFLGFCLKRHHKKLQEEKEKERQKSLGQVPLPGQFDMGPGPRRPRLPYHSGPRQSFTSPGYRSPSNRHEPYHIPRHGLRTSSDTSFTDPSQVPSVLGQTSTGEESIGSISMKTEPDDDNESGDVSYRDEDNTNSSGATNDQMDNKTGNAGNVDGEFVKVEAISESEFELEITGVTPGKPAVPEDNWSPNVSLGMDYDISQGATGSPSDAQGYNSNGSPKQYRCLQCPKMFTVKYRRDFHMRNIHMDSAPAGTVCEICNVRFSSSRNCRRHMANKHLGERNYPCDECDKRFTNSNDLGSHKRQHHGLEKFTCHLCNDQFAYKWSMNRHLKNCTGKARKLKCEDCNESFESENVLFQHKMESHPNSMYICEICLQVFDCVDVYTKHKKDVHEAEQSETTGTFKGEPLSGTEVEQIPTKVEKSETEVEQIATKVEKSETEVEQIATKVETSEAEFEQIATNVEQMETENEQMETKVEQSGDYKFSTL